MKWKELTCAVLGHAVDNRRFARRAGRRRCHGCGAAYLRRDGSATRVRHTLSCFLGRHTYRPTDRRHGHNEYVCVQCGHPLLFESGSDPYRRVASFEKKVRYLCGLTGHAVHVVCARNGFTEYACGCGHTFLLREPSRRRVRHPAVCVAGGHRVGFVEHRAGHDEFRCRDCGHPFGFVPPAAQASSRTYSTPAPDRSDRASSVESSSRTVTVNGSPKNICVLTESMSALTRT
jgi:hypothetical protein